MDGVGRWKAENTQPQEETEKPKYIKSGRRAYKRICLAMLLMIVSFCLFGAIYFLRLDSLQNFDSTKILDAPKSLIIYDKEGV